MERGRVQPRAEPKPENEIQFVGARLIFSPSVEPSDGPHPAGNSPGSVRCCDEEVNDHPVKHVQAVLHGPVGQTDRQTDGSQPATLGASGPSPPSRAPGNQGWYLRCLFFQEMVWKMVETMKRLDKPKP